MTPELIGILAVGVTLIGLLLALWRDTRTEIHALRAESRAENHALRAEVQAGDQRLREDFHFQMSNLRNDVQALSERTARLQGVVEGLAANRNDLDHRHDAA